MLSFAHRLPLWLTCAVVAACAPAPPPPPPVLPAVDEAAWRTQLAWIQADRHVFLDSDRFDARVRAVMQGIARGTGAQWEPELITLLRARPDAWPLWLELAQLRANAGFDFDGVRDASEACIERHPAQLQCRTLLGLSLYELGDHRRAKTVLDQVLAEDPRRPVALETATLLAMTARDHDRTVDLARRLLQQPERWEIRWLLALATAEEARGNTEQAEVHFIEVASRHRDRLQGLSFLRAFYQRTSNASQLRRIESEIQRLRQAREEPRPRMDPL